MNSAIKKSLTVCKIMPETRKIVQLNIQIKNKELKDVDLLEFEFIDSKVKMIFEYNEEFAKKYNLHYNRFPFDRCNDSRLNNIYTIVHDFANFRIPPPFGIEIIVDYTKKEVCIM